MATPPKKTYDEDVIESVEDHLTDLVTRTPAVTDFTAADVADNVGVDTWWASQALQRYRTLQSLGRTDFAVACVERGPQAKWTILAFPGMTKAQRLTSNELVAVYAVLTIIREVMRPMLRNIRTEFIPAQKMNISRNPSLINNHMSTLRMFKALLLDQQNNQLLVRPPKLRGVTRSLMKYLAVEIVKVDDMLLELSKL